MSFDLSAIKATTTRVEITHPKTAEPTGLVLHLRPLSHPDVKAVQRKFTNENLKHNRLKLSAEKLEANKIEALIAAIEAWEWNGEASWNGEKPALTPEAARAVLKVDWIRSQADDALGDEAAFFQG